jgi:succinate dehydrogenase / fumarate reductase iron-sulfur subunit
MKFQLTIWRQKDRQSSGGMENYLAENVSPDMSFLEMLDEVNERLIRENKEPIAFDHDCREGICGSCAMVINGMAHGPEKGTTACQLHMRKFADGERISIEPWRAAAFPVIRDLVTDRSALDRVIQAGGYVSVNTGGAPDGNAIPVPKENAESGMDAAACIGCGACVAACPNASAMLFLSAKVAHLANMPQGHAERRDRVLKMVEQHDKEGFGHCSNTYECEAACPKSISVKFIAKLNREYVRAGLLAVGKREAGAGDGAG